jgi:hypothetical protein
MCLHIILGLQQYIYIAVVPIWCVEILDLFVVVVVVVVHYFVVEI